jgi:hypothetical protein
MAFDGDDAVFENSNIKTADDGAQAITESGAVDVEGPELDVPWLLREPAARDVLAGAAISEGNDHVLFIRCDALIDQTVHGKTELSEERRRGPIERFSYKNAVDWRRFDTQDTESGAGEMNRRRGSSQSSA